MGAGTRAQERASGGGAADASPDPCGPGLHESVVYDDLEVALRRVVPFLREGLGRGEACVLMATASTRRRVLDALGPDAERALALVADAEEWWQGYAATARAWHRALERLVSSGRAVRAVAEPAWMRRPEGREWRRFDAVLNRMLADEPVTVLCLVDANGAPPGLLDDVAATHPLTWDGQSTRRSAGYRDPVDYIRSLDPPWRPRPLEALTLEVTTAAAARRAARRVGGRRSEEVVLAVHELVTNAVRAAGAARVSVWADPSAGDALVWEVEDDGPGMHDPTVGHVPAPDEAVGGRGLWLVRAVADAVSIRGCGPGSAVRAWFDHGTAGRGTTA